MAGFLLFGGFAIIVIWHAALRAKVGRDTGGGGGGSGGWHDSSDGDGDGGGDGGGGD